MFEEDVSDDEADYAFLQDSGFSELGETLYHREQEHEAMRRALKHSTVMFAGNPGTGKSTLLNSLIQPEQPQFKAGISFGAGLTRVCQEYTSERLNTTFVDTPGLNDISYVDEAAKEISEMLKHNANIGRPVKLGFFAQLNSGRVRPEDVTTMNAILDAINLPDMNDRFVLILNKLDPIEYRFLKDHSSEEFAKVVGCCFVKYKTNLVVTLPRESELETLTTPFLSHDNMKDVVVRLLQAESLTLDAHRLQDVDPREWEKKVQTIKAEMGELAVMLEEKDGELQKLVARQTKSDQEREALRTELDAQLSKLSHAHSDAERARAEAAALAQTMQDMNDRISELSMERERIVAEERAGSAELLQQIEELTRQLAAVQEERERLAAEQHCSAEDASVKMEAIERRVEDLTREREELVAGQGRQAELTSRLDDVTAQLQSLSEQRGEYESKVRTMEEERATMAAVLGRAEKSAKTAKKFKKRALAFATFGLSMAFAGKSHAVTTESNSVTA